VRLRAGELCALSALCALSPLLVIEIRVSAKRLQGN
jgi:hypothetical protein